MSKPVEDLKQEFESVKKNLTVVNAEIDNLKKKIIATFKEKLGDSLLDLYSSKKIFEDKFINDIIVYHETELKHYQDNLSFTEERIKQYENEPKIQESLESQKKQQSNSVNEKKDIIEKLKTVLTVKNTELKSVYEELEKNKRLSKVLYRKEKYLREKLASPEKKSLVLTPKPLFGSHDNTPDKNKPKSFKSKS